MGKRWTEEEIEYLVNNYSANDAKYISEHLNRKIDAIYTMAKKLKLFNGKRWTKNEIEYLRDNYGKIETKCIAENLGRTIKTTREKARLLGLCEKTEKHGMVGSRIYSIWTGMVNRCTPDNKKYKGTTICDEWRESFTKFYEWSLANEYDDTLTIDRISNYEGYSPQNCRWTDVKTQANNKTNNRYIEAFGEIKTLSQWSEDSRCQTTNSGLIYRLKNGYSPEEAILSPPGGKIKPQGKYRKRNYVGISYHPLYTRLVMIKYRCYNENCEHYKNYGGRGIKVCDEWLNSYEAFINWSINNGYDKNLTLDRINNDGNYEPDNCRWVNTQIQSNNRRSNTLVEAFNEKKSLAEWLRDSRCKAESPFNIVDRIKRGWLVEDAITRPVKRKGA